VQYSLNFEENETTSGCPSGTPAVRMSATSQPHTTTTSCSDNGMTCAATLSDPTLGNVTFSVGSGQGVTSFQTSQAVQYVLQYASPPPPQTTVSGRVTEPNGTVFPSSGAAGCPVGEPLVQGCPGFVVGFANPAGFYSMNVVPGISYNVVGFANGPSGLVLSVPVAVTLNAGETVTENFLVPVPTTVNYTGATQGAVGDPALVSATLTNDVSGSPVASELISFAVGSASCSATTNASGSAACILVPAGPPGASTVAANFAGNSQYFMSSNTMPFTVLGATCALCVLRPSAAPALSLTGNGSVSVSGSVAVNSSGKPAASLTGNGTVTATQIGGPGAPSQFKVTGNGRFSPTPVAESAVPDPLAALPECPDTAFPPNPCSTTVQSNVALTGNGSATINPGIYQSISLTGNGKLTLNPGVYVITGSLSVTGNGSLSGSGVTLYLACSTYPTPCATGKSGASFSLTGNGTVNLSAPTSGPFQGVSIFADRNNTATNTLTGNGSTIGGTIYAESANLTLTGNGQMLIGRLIVNMLTLTGNGSVTIG